MIGLALIEGALRLAGVGQSFPLFVPVPGAEDYRQANPRVVGRFMLGQTDTPKLRIDPVPFRADKAAETYRIIVQGGSTAAGYPYGYGASLAGVLEYRLRHTYPEHRLEVITTAMAAVNSYTLLDFADEIVAKDPDAVVIYAGHNEYLGILGVGSTFSVGSRYSLVRAFLALRDLRLFQLGAQALHAFAPESPPNRRRTLMARVVAEEHIPYRSELYRRGLSQYRINMGKLLQRYRDAGIPVLIGTVVANQRDQEPFVSGHGENIDRRSWVQSFNRGRNALLHRNPKAALAAFDKAIAADDQHAQAHFWRARALERLERYAEARHAYLAAKDRDQLRFRAPEAINEAIRALAHASGAHVVEVRAAFHANADQGIVGDDLMLEHVHPNVRGYAILGDAFYEALREHTSIGHWTRAAPRTPLSHRAPVSEVDRVFGQYRVDRLTAGWPFQPQARPYRLPQATNRIERIAQGLYNNTFDRAEALRRLRDYYHTKHEDAEADWVEKLREYSPSQRLQAVRQ